MLQAIRSQVGSWIVKILFAFLILSFAVWGIGDIFRGPGPDSVVAEIGQMEITVREVDQAFDDRLRELRRTLGPELDTETAISLGLLDQALDQLVETALLDQAAFDTGIRPSDELLADLVRQQEVFHDPETGRFSRARFENALSQTRLTEEGYLQSLRREITQRLITGPVIAAGQLPAVMAEELLRFRGEGRVAEIVRVDAAGLAATIPAPTDADLTAFHQDNPDRYTAPEYRDLSVVLFTAQDLADEIQLSEQDVLDEYFAQADRYQRNEPIRRFDQILLATNQADLANNVAAEARRGLDLNAAAAAAGAVGISAITLDWTTQGEMLPALADIAFSLPSGGVSDPVQSPFGWHVLVVTDVADDGILPLEAVREEVEGAARLNRALDSLFEVANAFDDALAGGSSLDEAGASLGLEVRRLPALSAAAESRDGMAPPPIIALPSIVETAFALPEGELSTLEETAARDGYFVVRVDRVIEPALRPLAEVRAQVANDWRADRQLAAAREIADAAASRLAGGVSAVTAAAGIPAAEAAQTEALLRDGSNRGVWPPALVERLYAMTRSEVAVVLGSRTAFAVRLDEVLPATPDDDAIAEVQRSTGTAIAEDLLIQFVAGLRQLYEVEIDQSALDVLRSES